jgi:hypothetical protein
MPANKPTTESPAEAAKLGNAGIDSPLAVGTVAIQAWADVGAEAVRFVWDRLQQDLKTQQAMLACTSLEEMRTIQAAFFRSAQEQYATESSKMLEMMGKAATAGLSAAGKGRRYDDVPV